MIWGARYLQEGMLSDWIRRTKPPIAGGACVLPQTPLKRYQTTFQPLLYGVGFTLLITLVLKETGPAEAA